MQRLRPVYSAHADTDLTDSHTHTHIKIIIFRLDSVIIVASVKRYIYILLFSMLTVLQSTKLKWKGESTARTLTGQMAAHCISSET